MPTIPITTQHLAMASGVAIVGAVMLFSDDPKAQAEYQAAAAKQWAHADMKAHGLEIDAGGALWLATHPTAQDGAAMLRDPYRRGSRAGEILLQALEGKPVKRAQADAAKELGEIYSASARTFEVHAWPTFKQVSHLWAVHLEWVKHRITAAFPCAPAQLRAFLTNADALLARAIEADVLDVETAWRLPSGLLA